MVRDDIIWPEREFIEEMLTTFNTWRQGGSDLFGLPDGCLAGMSEMNASQGATEA